MTPLFTKNEFETAKPSDLLPLKCDICNQTFHHKKSYIKHASKRTDIQCLKYCSKKCNGIFLTTKKEIICYQCGTMFSRPPNEIKKTKHQFCSRSCSAKYYNAHKTTGCRRSKLEKWIEEQLISKYPNLSIDYNKTNTINAELDIYIPSLKLAFELNGIFHYEPIFGEQKLLSHQTNDARKFQACLERGIELCVIDTHNAKYLKKERDKRFLDIINNVINKKMETMRSRTAQW